MRGVLGRLAEAMIILACFWSSQEILVRHEPANLAAATRFGYAAWLVGAYVAGMVVHELGHAAAVRLVGSKVDAIQFGGSLLRFTVAGVSVSVGIGLGGHVVFDARRMAAARRALVLLAGPAANLLAASASFLLPVPRWEAAYVAVCVLSSALFDLLPGRDIRDGSPSDGAQLARIPATIRATAGVRELLATPDWVTQPRSADTLIDAFRLDVPEAEDCLRELSHEPGRLVPFYRQDWTLPEKPEADVVHITDVLTWKVLCTGELPAVTVDLAASRAEWVLGHRPADSDDKRIAKHRLQPTLALARLRQGRTGDVRRLCAGALAAGLDPGERASVLAMVAMAKHARLLSGRAELDEAVALDPEAPLVAEAVTALSCEPEVLRRNPDAVTA